MIRGPPGSRRTDTLCPYTTLFRALVSGTLNLGGIVNGQGAGWFAEKGINFMSWNWLPLLPLFVIYVVSAVAETNRHPFRSEEHTSELQSLMRISYAVFCLKKKTTTQLYIEPPTPTPPTPTPP